MVEFSVRCVLLDIEGTTSSIRFVHEVMFPLVRARLTSFLSTQWGNPMLQETLDLVARDVGYGNAATWLHGKNTLAAQACVVDEIQQQMDADRKATGLKQLQGMLWQEAFDQGELIAHVYPDVVPALCRWQALGIDLRIFSSGSVTAQRLFFGHTREGNLLDFFTKHYDTTTGSKRQAESYREIATDAKLSPTAILFASDIPEELSAAREAGYRTVLVVRPENAAVADAGHPRIESFEELALTPLVGESTFP